MEVLMKRLLALGLLSFALTSAPPVSIAQQREPTQPVTRAPQAPPPPSNQTPAQQQPNATVLTPGDVGRLVGAIRQLASGCRQAPRTVQIIRVIAVFGADDDGSRATATPIRAQTSGAPPLRESAATLRPYRPVAPYLASASGEDYVMEWIRRTNRVLANSDAPFRLSESDVAYDLVRNTDINSLAVIAHGPGEADDEAVAETYFRNKVNGANPDPRYAGRLVMHFPWGSDTNVANGPRGGGFSDINMWSVSMPARVYGGTRWGTQEIWGWYMMAHELGHFLGLQHTAIDPPWFLFEAYAQGHRSPTLLPDGGISYAIHGADPGRFDIQASSPQLSADVAFAMGLLNGAAVFDGDSYGVQRTMTYANGSTLNYNVAGVSDTPPDMGLGWAPSTQNRDPCTAASATVNGTLYSNVTNRTNPMSYSLCITEGMRFTPGQVAVMAESLTLPHRSYFISHVERVAQVCTPAASRIPS
jgi:hypothetical protein